MEPHIQTLGYSFALFALALFFRGLFSFLETSITALRLFKLKELAAQATKYKGLFQVLEKKPQRILITILLANSLADVTTATLATYITEHIFSYLNLSSGIGFSLGIVIATIAIVVFGEIIPKSIAKSRSENLLHSTLWVIQLVYTAFYPLVTLLLAFSDSIVSRFSRSNAAEQSDWVTSESEIRFLINYIQQKGLMEDEKSRMLQSIFELGITPVRAIMVPATDIIAVNSESSSDDALKKFITYNFTRLPVYDKRPDNIIGLMHLKDLLLVIAEQKKSTIKELMRPVMMVPESMKINQLLKQFRQKHLHMAMVINEHGSLIGLITLEDILEEIVGEISDEHESDIEKIIQLKDGSFLVDGSTPLHEIAGLLDITFDDTRVLTLGGFIAERLQHLPKKDERVLYKGYSLLVKQASPKRVRQVHIKKKNA